MNEIVFRLGLVSLFNDISTEMLYPITPIFLTAVLGASMTSVGVIEGLSEFIASMMKVYFGRWSDAAGQRKQFVIVGYSVSTVARPLIGFARSWPFVLVARAFDRVGKAVRSAPRDALLAESVERRFLGRALGWHRGLDSFGAFIGPLVAIALLKEDAHHLRLIFFLAAIPALIAVLLVFSVRETKRAAYWRADEHVDAADWLTRNSPRSTVASHPQLPLEFRKYLLGWGVFALANSSDAFLLLKMRQMGLTLTLVIFLYAFYNLIYSLTSPWLGHLSDQLGRKRVLLFGFGLFALVYFGFTRAHSSGQFASLLAVYGIYMGATDGVGKAWAVDLVSPEVKATALGALGTVTGVGALVASLTAGLIWDHVGATGPFLFGAVAALMSAALLLFVRSPDTIEV